MKTRKTKKDNLIFYFIDNQFIVFIVFLVFELARGFVSRLRRPRQGEALHFCGGGLVDEFEEAGIVVGERGVAVGDDGLSVIDVDV